MGIEQKKYSLKLKPYHIILIACLFVLFLLLNSNYINNKRNQEKLNLEKSYLFDEIIKGRNLEEIQKGTSNSTKVCERISNGLKEYYETGDKEVLGIEDEEIKGDSNEYITALINIVKYLTLKKDDEKKLRNIDEEDPEINQDELKENYIIYGKHILPVLIFFVIAILSFPGWITCISCYCCCNCICCCCCKKTKCKLPCFVISFICYGIVALICFYSLGKSNTIFYGISDTECSILKFVDEVLYGETNKNPPYWAGIDEITKILNNLKEKIGTMKNDRTIDILDNGKANVDAQRNSFEDNLKNAGNNINYDCTSTTSNDCYYTMLGGKKYQLDIANIFGTYDFENKRASPSNSICDLWIKEYKNTATNSDYYLTLTQESFEILLQQNSVTESLDTSKKSIKKMEQSFEVIKKKLAGNIIKNGDKFDKYGRLGYTILFTTLILIDAALAAFMLMLCFCSGKICNCCCCCKCFFKFFIHVLWNIMAISMIALFIFGSFFAFFGNYGKDLTSVLAFLVSEENLGENKDTILFGDVKKYLNKCFNYNGDISNELGFDDVTKNSFEQIKEAENNIGDIINEFKNKQLKFVYTEYLEQLNERVNYNSKDLSLIEILPGTEPSNINFVELLNIINDRAKYSHIEESWELSGFTNDQCNDNESTSSTKIVYHPKFCWPTNKNWVKSDSNLLDTKEKLDKIKDLINFAKGSDDKSIKIILENLGGTDSIYENFLSTEIGTLETFKQKIQEITNIVSKYSGKNEKLFNFINCGFMKTNIQIIIKNLNDAFGNDMYTIGICFLLAACSLSIAIICTILLIAIINLNNNDETKEGKDGDVPEIPTGSEDRALKSKK